MPSNERGFTLLQALIAMAIAALIAGLAMPAYTHTVSRVRINDAATALAGDLLRASAEALARSSHVSLCPSIDGTSCSGGSDWSGGWIGFVDANANHHRDADESLVASREASQANIRILYSAGRDRITYQPRGDASGTNGTFVLCGRGHANAAVSLVLANNGRWRVAKAAAPRAAACSRG